MRDCGSVALEIRYIRQGAKRWHEDSRARAISGLTAAAVNGEDGTDGSSGRMSQGSRIWHKNWQMNRIPIYINRY